MREALNNNPVAQVGLVLVLVAVAAFMFMSKSGGGGEGEAGASLEGPTVATVNGATATGATPGEAVEGAIENLAEGGAVGAESGAMPTSVPAPPPPHEFTAAYDSGKTVVLLVVHDGGIDDRLTAAAASVLTAVPQVELIPVPVKKLPRYASVTVGLDLNRVPALVVLKPKRLSGGIPQATVDYGFQTPESILLAVADANYKGPEVSYHPE